MRNLSVSPLSARLVAGVIAGTLASAVLLTADPARAQPAAADAAKPAEPAKKAEPDWKTKQAAKKAWDEGKKAYGEGAYSTAAEAYKKANETIPSPHAQYWYAMSLDKADPADEKLADKIIAFETFLADPGAEKVGEGVVPAAQARLAELKAKAPATVNLSWTPESAQITVDGAPQTGTPPLALTLAPGTHKITVAAEGFVAKELEVTVAGSQVLEQAVALEPVPPPPPPAEPAPEPPPPPPPPPPEKPSKAPAYVTLGIAGAGLVVGSVFGVMALDKKSEFEDAPDADTADQVERNALIADMSFGVAITLGVTGIVLLTSNDPVDETARRAERAEQARRLQLAPYASRNGGGAVARLRF